MKRNVKDIYHELGLVHKDNDKDKEVSTTDSTKTKNPLLDLIFSNQINPYNTDVAPMDSNLVNYLDSIWTAYPDSTKNKILQDLMSPPFFSPLKPPTQNPPTMGPKNRDEMAEGGDPGARRKRDRLPEKEPLDKATFWSVTKDIGKYAINQLTSPIETIIGRDFYDPKYSNTKFGQSAGNVDEITSVL